MVKNILCLEEESLLGKIKSFKKIVDGELERTSTYDADGFEIERATYEDGLVTQSYKLQKNSEGLYITILYIGGELAGNTSMIFSQFNKDFKLIYSDYLKISCDYDANGRLVKKSYHEDDGRLTSYNLYEYPEYERIKKKYQADNTFFEKEIERYDERGNVVLREVTDEKGNSLDKDLYYYDSDGKEVNHLIFSGGELMDSCQTEYDDITGLKTIVIDCDEHWGGGQLTNFSYELDDLNRIAIQKETDRGKLLRKVLYEYDYIGNVISITNTTNYFDELRSSNTVLEFTYYPH